MMPPPGRVAWLPTAVHRQAVAVGMDAEQYASSASRQGLVKRIATDQAAMELQAFKESHVIRTVSDQSLSPMWTSLDVEAYRDMADYIVGKASTAGTMDAEEYAIRAEMEGEEAIDAESYADESEPEGGART